MHALPAYRVTTRQRVSWFTQETLIGLLVPLTIPPLIALAPVGALVGGMFGRARIQRENREGKIVSPPSHINKTLILGLALGVVAMTGVGMLAGIGGWLAAGAFSLEAGSTILTAFNLASIGAVAAAGYMGAVNGRHYMEAEYHYARLSGIPMDGHKEEQKPNPDRMLEYFDGMDVPQKKFVAEEIARRQKRGTETDKGGTGHSH